MNRKLLVALVSCLALAACKDSPRDDKANETVVTTTTETTDADGTTVEHDHSTEPSAMDKAADKMNEMKENTQEKMHDMKEGAEHKMEELKDKAHDMTQDVKDHVADAAQNTHDALKGNGSDDNTSN